MPVRRGEVYFIDLSPAIGREQKARRPVVVVSADRINNLPLVVAVVPGTKTPLQRADYPQNAQVPAGEANLPQDTIFLAFQVRAVDPSRFVDPPVGQLRQEWMDKIDAALAYSLQLRLSFTNPR